jgi:hypothetical protein
MSQCSLYNYHGAYLHLYRYDSSCDLRYLVLNTTYNEEKRGALYSRGGPRAGM